MDESKVNPADTGTGANAVPVNPYAPAGAPYSAGSGTPPPSYASPAVPYTGDYVDPNARPPLFTKKMKIFLIVAAALLAITAVVALVLANRSNTTTSTAPTESPLAAFSRYANYVVSGSSSTERLAGTYNNRIEYFADAFYDYASSSPDMEKINTAKAYLDAFNSSYRASASSLNADIQGYIDYFNTFYIIASLKIQTSSEIGKTYLTNGREAILNAITIEQAADEYLASSYRTAYETYVDSVIALYDVYRANGCVSDDGTVSDLCLLNTKNQSLLSAMNREAESRSSLLEVISSAISEIVAECWGIEASLAGGAA